MKNLILLAAFLFISSPELGSNLGQAMAQVEARGDCHVQNKTKVTAFDLTTLTPARANRAFRDLAQNSSIPFAYHYTGCEVRAYAAADFLASKNIMAGKIFAESHEGRHIKVNSEDWDGLHVAVLIRVRTNKTEELYVIDPALFDEPVPLSQWRAKLTQQPESDVACVSIAPRTELVPGITGVPAGFIEDSLQWQRGELANATHPIHR